MFATLLETPGNPAPKPGDLVLIEVPLNCTIHSADAARLSRMRTLASEIREQWRGIRTAQRAPGATPAVVAVSVFEAFKHLMPLFDELAEVADAPKLDNRAELSR
ncbi:MAG TPA: hypothetical protein VFD36_16770 [Kofleriaceae bacterium]|nr:hypothetical protein [Kofleriaceae bacterium]